MIYQPAAWIKKEVTFGRQNLLLSGTNDNNGFAEILNEIVRYAHDEILAKLG